MANAITNYFAGVRRRWDKLQAKQEEERARDRAERAATGNEPDLSGVRTVMGAMAVAAAGGIVRDFFTPPLETEDERAYRELSQYVAMPSDAEVHAYKTSGIGGVVWIMEQRDLNTYGD